MKKYIKLIIASTFLWSLSALASPVLLEEILVTAQKRTENIQDVPISVSALSGEQLEALGFDDLTDVAQQIPSLQVNSWSPQLSIFNIRGVSQNNFVDNLEAPIAIYHDDSYIASINALSGQIFDLERVEVLRGPQGTLFGRNATGGLVHYISRKADDDEFNGYAKLEVGSFAKIGFEAAIGGSISNGFRARLAIKSLTADGYIEPDQLIPPVDKRAIGGADGSAIRLSLQADINDNWGADFLIKSNVDNRVPTGGYVFENCTFDADEYCPIDKYGRAITLPGVVSKDPHIHQNDTSGFLERETSSITAKFVGQLSDNMDLTLITNILDIDKQYLEDGDAFPAPIVVFAQDAKISQFSQEIRLSSENEKLSWQVGLYFLDFSMDGDAYTIGAPNIDLSFSLQEAGTIDHCVVPEASGAPCAKVGDENPFDGRSDRYTKLTVQNSALFGQFDYNLDDNSILTFGLRFSSDQKDIDWSAFFSSDSQQTPIVYAATQSNENYSASSVLNQFEDDSISYDDFALRLSYTRQFNEETMGFISYNRGIKGGNWTLSSGVSPDNFQHKPEILSSIEIGVKSTVSERLRVNATVYNYIYQDYQTFVAIPQGANSPNPQIGNSDAAAVGAEVELFYTPNERLDILLGAAISKSKVDAIAAGSATLNDAELPSSPALSFNYLLRYAIRENLVFQFNGAYYGDQFLEVTNGPGTVQGAYNVSNLSLNYDISTDSKVSLWVKNVFDESYKQYSLDLGFLGATTYYAPPQTLGITAVHNF